MNRMIRFGLRRTDYWRTGEIIEKRGSDVINYFHFDEHPLDEVILTFSSIWKITMLQLQLILKFLVKVPFGRKIEENHQY